jgi:hypothetical protein
MSSNVYFTLVTYVIVGKGALVFDIGRISPMGLADKTDLKVS